MTTLKKLKLGDITRIASELDISPGYVQKALRGQCESQLCKNIRDYADFIVAQYDAREEYLIAYFKSLRS